MCAESRIPPTLYRQIIEQAGDAVLILDEAGGFVEQNPAHRQLFGYTDDQLRHPPPAFYTDESVFAAISRACQEQGRFFGEISVQAENGHKLEVELRAFAVSDQSRSPAYYAAFIRDITERRRDEQQRLVQQRLREAVLKMEGLDDMGPLMEVIGEGLELLDIPYHNHGINVLSSLGDSSNAYLRLRSVSREGRQLTSDTPKSMDILTRMWRSGGPTYRPDLEADDSFGERGYLQRHARIRAVVDVPFSHGTLAVNSTRPDAFSPEHIQFFQQLAAVLSEGFNHLEDQQQLALSEASYRTLVETPNFVVMLLDREGEYIYVSPQVSQWVGYQPEDFYNNPQLGSRIIAPEYLGAVDKVFARALAGKASQQLEYRAKTKDGKLRWVSQSIFPIYEGSGSVHTVQVVVHDITDERESLERLERANRELIETQGQLVRAEKMAALGNLIAGIAHEINTPVGAINSMHDTMMRAVEKLKGVIAADLPAGCLENRGLQRALKVIEDSNRIIESGTQRVTEIVRSLRNHARMDDAELRATDIHGLLDDSLMLIYNAIKNRVEIIKEYGELPQVYCYPGRLNQVFLNLIKNAGQAIEGSGKITIATTLCGPAEVEVAISDTGKGISAENLEKIFEQGFTTKGKELGTGYGLTISSQIVAEHQGRIEVESQVGVGTTFKVVIPVKPEEGQEGG